MQTRPPVKPDAPDIPAELDRPDVGPTLAGTELECAVVEGVDFSGQRASSVRFAESRLNRIDLTGAELIAASLNDVAIAAGSWANVRTKELRLRRVAFKGVRMTGADLAYANFEDVSFVDCKIDLAFFVGARMTRARFERCGLDEVDWTDANLSSVAFDACSLARTVWTDAFLTTCEMRGCDISGAAHLDRLRGVRMPVADVVAAAQDLAAALGIEILE